MKVLMRNPLADSVKLAGLKEEEYVVKAKTAARAGVDSNVWHKYIDTSTLYLIHHAKLENQLKALEFAIDSLSKMK